MTASLRIGTRGSPLALWQANETKRLLAAAHPALAAEGAIAIAVIKTTGDRIQDRTLAEAPGRPTVVAMHHPPFVTGIGHMDRVGLSGSEALAQVIARHPQVERIIAGHLHRPITVRFAKTVAGTCPSPAHRAASASKQAGVGSKATTAPKRPVRAASCSV
jgi:hypothetical protein